MKKLFKLGLIALSCVCAFSLLSCDSEEIASPLDNVIDYSGFPDIDMEAQEVGGLILSSISIDTTKGKVNYYVGEKFTTEGMVIYANYIQMVNGNPQGSKKEVENYFYDDKDVDMNKAGKYVVEFKYREGSSVFSYNLEINVTESYLADLGLEYLAGLEPEETVVTVTKDSTFDAKKAVTFKKKYMQGTKDGIVETKVEDMTAADIDNLKIESTVNTAKKGKYTVYYSYDTSVTLEDNTVYNYTLKSFIVVIVA